MNKVLQVLYFILLSFAFIVVQSTVLSPRNLGDFHPDLNLILIIFLALFSDVRGNAIIALGNGFMMDVLSGYMFGVFALSRFSVFAILQGFSISLYSHSRLVHGFAIFFGTLFSWFFLWAAFKIKADYAFPVSLGGVAAQCLINVLVGIPLFQVISKLYARI